MRIYEFAKESGISSKEILSTLSQAGIELSSHMAVLPENALAILKKKYSQKKVEPIIPKKELPREDEKKEKLHVAKTESSKKVENIVQHEPSRPKPVAPQIPEQPKVIILQEESPVERGPQLKYYDKPVVPEIQVAEDQDAMKIVKGQDKVNRFLAQLGIKRPKRRSSAAKRRKLRAKVAIAEAKSRKKEVTGIKIEKSLPLGDVAEMMNKPVGDLIVSLLRKGLVCNRNHVLSPDIIRSLAEQFGLTVDYQVQPDTSTGVESKTKNEKNEGKTRWPIVVVMGHVDHGKTTLLDYIRKMNVAASEKGGITQHIRAYEVNSTHGKIVFLDTPGHEAFTHMRQRGATITDIAVLVIAADDGVKPQTVEAINHAKAAGVPIVVAINKIDKAQSPAAVETIKRQLAQYELMSEDWGGQTIVVPISAKTGQGVNELLEMIILQSQLMDLRANFDKPAKAFVVESRMGRGLGAVATVICTEGTLKQGDFFICGHATGKVRLLINSQGARISQAEPSIPVQISGFDDFSSLGDWLEVVPVDVYLKAKSSRLVEATQSQELTAKVTLESVANDKNKKFINLIIKTDTRGSREAVMDSIDKLLKQNKAIKCPIYVIASGVGDITENDVELAANTNSLLLGLHIKPEKNALTLSKDRGVEIQAFQIIYKLIDYLQSELNKRKEVVYTWKKTGEATVKKVFDIKGVGIIAGCYMRDGLLTRGNKVTCERAGRSVGEGVVTSLQRDRKSVKEIHAGYECGFTCDGFNEWQEGDTVLCFTQVKTEEK